MVCMHAIVVYMTLERKAPTKILILEKIQSFLRDTILVMRFAYYAMTTGHCDPQKSHLTPQSNLFWTFNLFSFHYVLSSSISLAVYVICSYL